MCELQGLRHGISKDCVLPFGQRRAAAKANELGADVDVASPLPAASRAYIESIQDSFSVEGLLVKVLQELGWSEYLASGAPDWSKIVISGHSQGASHAGYMAAMRDVRGALLLSGPQDACGNDGASWVAEASQQAKQNIFGCYAMDEPGKPAIERNLAFMTEVSQVNMTDRSISSGGSAWCAPPTHCATGVDDQLADAVVEQCFGKLARFGRLSDSSFASSSQFRFQIGILVIYYSQFPLLLLLGPQ